MWYQNLVPGFPGSSPLTLGKPVPPPCTPSVDGLIPAHAGKTPSGSPYAASSPAHPRSRGENGFARLTAVGLSGSSPLTRGKRVHRREGRRTRRLIPAHAGKTTVGDGVHFAVPAHPRSRGENAAGIASVALTQGSSPLTRGKRTAPALAGEDLGLIPAHAGKTLVIPLADNIKAAHPRSRGENSFAVAICVDDGGSSPLTRGKQE